ncbi:hypothetical protein SUSAZ_08980 [Sulfolobus acidocaldarius SUSAZ]|nr:hypothetical protein SUSAZ_08980 [Sulfolobus acidocaldarius SUSAZ]
MEIEGRVSVPTGVRPINLTETHRSIPTRLRDKVDV